LSLFIGLVFLSNTYAQKKTDTAYALTPNQVSELFPDSILKSFNINFPIFRVYKYNDHSGKYFCIMTEERNEMTLEKDSFYNKIKAVNVRAVNDSYVKVWEINDNIDRDQEENSIWFWTKYVDFRDYDGDGLKEPVVIYGTSVSSGPYGERIKIMIYYKGQKIAIRHQNNDRDIVRETKVDKAFYDLPMPLQAAIKQKMELMMKNGHALFPYGWQTAMKNRRTTINERK
jgi:hypothetical protein